MPEAIPTRPDPETTSPAPAAAPNPVKAGLDWIQESYVRGKGASSALSAQQAQELPALGFSREEERAIAKAVDPNDELTLGARRIAQLDAVYNHYLSKKNAGMASQMAGKLLASWNDQAQALGRKMLQAYDAGDMDSVVKFAQRAYNLVPDGKTINVQMVEGQPRVQVFDPLTNTTEDMGTIGPQQVVALAKGLAGGTDYYARVAALASGQRGRPQQTPEEAGRISATRRYATQSFEDRTSDVAGKVDEGLGLAGADKEGRYKEDSIAAAVKKAGGDAGAAKTQIVRLADNIMAKGGYNGDPTILAEFLTNAALLPQVSLGLQRGPDGSFIAKHKGSTITIPMEDVRTIAALRAQRIDTGKKNLAEADAKREADEKAKKEKADRDAAEREARAQEQKTKASRAGSPGRVMARGLPAIPVN